MRRRSAGLSLLVILGLLSAPLSAAHSRRGRPGGSGFCDPGCSLPACTSGTRSGRRCASSATQTARTSFSSFARRAEDLGKAFEAAAKGRVQALLAAGGPPLYGLHARITELALKHHLPATYYINLKAAKALGLTIPQSLPRWADEIIQ